MLSIYNVVVDRRRASIVAGHIATRLTGRAASKLVPLLSSPPDYVCMTYDTRIALHSPKFCITAWIDQCLFRTRFWSFGSFWSFWSCHRDFLLGVWSPAFHCIITITESKWDQAPSGPYPKFTHATNWRDRSLADFGLMSNDSLTVTQRSPSTGVLCSCGIAGDFVPSSAGVSLEEVLSK